MSKNNEEKLTRAEFRKQQKKSWWRNIIKRKEKSASTKVDDDFLVFNEEDNNTEEEAPELTSAEKTSILKHKLNLGIIITFVLLLIVLFVLFKI